MRSIISSQGQLIDRRKLSLRGTSLMLTEQQVDELTKQYYLFVDDLCRECVLIWESGKHCVKWKNERIELRKQENGAFILTMRGNVRCDTVYNKATFRRFEREKCYPQIPHSLAGSRSSVDYPKNAPLPNDIDAVHAIFDLEGRYDLGESEAPDVLGGVVAVPHECNQRRFSVEFFLELPKYCLEEALDQAADSFLKFGIRLSQNFPNTNISIDLNARREPYSFYFGRYPLSGSKRFSFIDWTRSLRCLYITEPGWAHILSEKTRKLGIRQPIPEDRLMLCELQNNALLLRTDIAISKLTVSQRKQLKRCLYQTILPRSNQLDLKCGLRLFWEEVPVMEDEITFGDNSITFVHYGAPNEELLCESLTEC